MNCEKCGSPFKATRYTTGYGTTKDGKKFCYSCCAELTKEEMRRDGKIMLYFSYDSPNHNPQFTSSGINLTASDYKVSDWGDGLSIRPTRVKVGKHNIAKRRWDVWFQFENTWWYGVNYGDMTQILHCRRVKSAP